MNDSDKIALSLVEVGSRVEELAEKYEDAARHLIRSVGMDYAVAQFDDLAFTQAGDELRQIHKRWVEAIAQQRRLRVALGS